MSDAMRLIVQAERRFGRLQAYEALLHWLSLALCVAGGVAPGCGAPRWVYLACFGLSAATRAGWSRVMDEEQRQHALVMANDWESLDRILRR